MSAQRASAPVRLARLAAAIGIMALALIIAIRLAGRRSAPAPETPVAPPPEGRIVDVKERVRHAEYRDGRPVVDIRGAAFFRGPDGRNHLTGAVEILNLGPSGETGSRLTADEVAYDPDSLRFTVSGRVRVEAGGVVLEGERFDYDKAAQTFGTTAGGRFVSKTARGEAREISYRERADEIRLGGGFRAVFGAEGRPDEALDLSGESLVYARPERQVRIEGPATLAGARFRASARTISGLVSADEEALGSAVLEGAAKVGFDGPAGEVRRGGELAADRVEAAFAREPFALDSVRTAGPAFLTLRSAADRDDTVLASLAVLKFGREGRLASWSASGGVRAEMNEPDGTRRMLEGETAEYGAEAGTMILRGRGGRPALADSPQARAEAPSITVRPASGALEASGGARCVFKRGQDRRTIGFFSSREDVVVTGDELTLLSEASSASFSGAVLAQQGENSLRAARLEILWGSGEMRGRGGVTASLTGPPAGGSPDRRTELGGRDLTYLSESRRLTLTAQAYVRWPDAGLEAGAISALLDPESRKVESLAASKAVIVSSGRYVGRSEAASYDAAAGRITLTGRPVLTDDKGGSARGAKLTFDLTDDKILIENEGPGRATTVVRS